MELMYSQRSAYSNMVSVNVSILLQWDQRTETGSSHAKLAIAEQMRCQREEATGSMLPTPA